MTQELTHRADELKELGWSVDDLNRYVELWDYRQRWGAINLEREDRLFLRKADSVLPTITKVKPSVKKPLREKSYYRWLKLFLDEMSKLEVDNGLAKGARGLWAVVLEEELRLLDYYQPVLGLPDTFKAKQLTPIREAIVKKAIVNYGNELIEYTFDFSSPLNSAEGKEKSNWRDLRDEADNRYPVLDPNLTPLFRKEVRRELLSVIPSLFPSLVETDKPEPHDDWIPD